MQASEAYLSFDVYSDDDYSQNLFQHYSFQSFSTIL